MDERTPGYYAVIPASVRYDDAIPANAKLLYGEISALVGSEGFCYAKNSYFAELFKLSERTISSLISSLQKGGYITAQLEKDESGLIVARKIYLAESAPDGQPIEENFYPPRKNLPGGIEENFQYTNSLYKENIKESPAEKKQKTESSPKTDFDPLTLFVEWIGKTFGDETSPEAKNAIYFALVRFSENRAAIKKPMKSKGAVTALCNRLMRLSSGNGDPVGAIIDMLDTATSSGWQSVYPPKTGAPAKGQKPQGGRCYEEL